MKELCCMYIYNEIVCICGFKLKAGRQAETEILGTVKEGTFSCFFSVSLSRFMNKMSKNETAASLSTDVMCFV